MMRNMKDSGIEWIGEIPEDWEIKRLKWIGEAIIGLTYEPDDVADIGTLVMRSSNVKDGQLLYDDNVYVNISINEKLLLKKGDILICSRNGSRALIGKCAIIDEIAENNTFGAFMTVFRSNYNDFMYYIFNSPLFTFHVGSFLTSTINQLTTSNLYSITVPMPPKHLQTAIANYLDDKCGKIDSIMKKTRKQIELLKEYKQSVITEAVTKGLDSDAPMKDSGIEWIRNIPESWEVKKLKNILRSPLKYGANETGILFNENLPRYIRITDISLDNRLRDDNKLSLEYQTAKPYMLENGDILFARSGATVGKTFLFVDEYGISCFAGYLIKAQINCDYSYKYFYYFTLSLSYEEWKSRIFIQATIQNIGASKYSNMEIVVPTIAEQTAIANFLDEKCSKIDTIITQKEALLDKLDSYKKSLIYEAVTGKAAIE